MSREELLKNLPLINSPEIPDAIRIRGVSIGGGRPVIIAGPCAVESAGQILTTAEFIRARGVQGLRGGVYKPRSSPYSFQGLGQKGLEYLARAREETGLFTVVEVTSVPQIEEALGYADIFQIGARNMQNFELLKAVGRSRKPVLLKRGLSATIQELLQAAEYILNEGNFQVILCERGIRTFEPSTRNTLDINAIALLKQLTRLPVFADPSHGTGHRDLVIPVAKAALSAGADGLIIEVHPEPNTALSDGCQSLDFQEFSRLMQELPGLAFGKITGVNELKAQPDLQQFAQMCATGRYHYVPVYCEVVVDAETPVTVFAKLTDGNHRFLLESVDRGEQVGRYSFIGWNPLLTVTACGDQVTVTDAAGECLIKRGPDPLAQVHSELEALQVALLPELGKFYGGAVGYLGYDYVRSIENLPVRNEAAIGLPDFHWMIPQYLARFDHVTHRLTVIALTKVNPAQPEQAYAEARSGLNRIVARLEQPVELPHIYRNSGGTAGERQRQTSLTKSEYLAGVERIKEYINAGDAFQVVFSQRIAQPFGGDPFEFYRLLRTINPSPYLFYLDCGGFQLAGSSPEVMVRLEGDEVLLKPIAGTRPRGGTPGQDAALSRELLNDEKERAEHVMLVDLGRNDLGRVCRFGSVRVSELMTVEYYSHVMHIVSAITGKLLPGVNGVDLLRAVFPAGTLSGAPKVRAMEIIEELEPVRREVYGGAVGYLGFNGNVDTCITIRTVLFKDRQALIQVGAGIVADSDPEREYEETMNKAGALLTALERVSD